jgi:hypothetical protein
MNSPSKNRLVNWYRFVSGQSRAVLLGLISLIFSCVIPELKASESVALEILFFEFTPGTVDVSAGPAEITFTSRIVASGGEFTYATFDFESPVNGQPFFAEFGEWNRISGTSQDGIYQTTAILSEYSEEGTWEIAYIELHYHAGYLAQIWGSDAVAFMQSKGLPYQIVVQNENADTTLPEILSFDFTPHSVDLSEGPVEITFTARVIDSHSGFSYAHIDFEGPSSGQRFAVAFHQGNIISGTEQDGIYETTVTLSEFKEPGTWEVTLVSLEDLAGNLSRRVPGFDSASYLQSNDFPYQLSVQNENADTTAPEILSFYFTPNTVDEISGPAEITVTARIVDSQSGFSRAMFDFESPTTGEYFWVDFYSGDRISGSEFDGIYQTTRTLPQNSETGIWELRHVEVSDRVGNRMSLRDAQAIAYLRSNGFPFELFVGVSSQPVQLGNFGPVMQKALGFFQSDTFGLLASENSWNGVDKFFSHSLQAYLHDDGTVVTSSQYGQLSPNPWDVPQWVVSQFFGLVHFGEDGDQYAGWVSSERFGWMRFVAAGDGTRYLWVHRLQTWMAVNPDGSFHSFDFGWLVPETGSFTHYNSRIGILIDDEHNPPGWLRNDRFGFVWFARDGTGVWFWSSNRNEWIGITDGGGLWSTVENRFL